MNGDLPWQTSNFDFTINAHSEKCSEGRCLFRMHTLALFPARCRMFVYTETSTVFTIKYLHVLLVV